MLLANVTRPRAAQRQRRSPHPVAPRRARSPRLRAREADRPSIRRRAQVSRRVAVPDALPPRAPRPDSGTMGREERSTAQTLLPSNRGGTEDAGLAAAKLERVLRRAEQSRANPARVESHARLEESDPRARSTALGSRRRARSR